MKLLYVGLLPPHSGGGACRDAGLLTMLAQRGHRVSALAPGWPNPTGEGPTMSAPAVRVDRFPEGPTMSAPAVRVDRFPMSQADYGGPGGMPAPALRQWHEAQVTTHLRRLVGRDRPDLVVVGVEFFVPGVPELARRLGLPWVALSHGLTPHRLAEHGDFGARLLADMAQADLVLSCAHHLAESLVRAGIPRAMAVPNGVDTAGFRPFRPGLEPRRALGIPPGALVALHASTLKAIKRPLDLVASAEIAIRECPEMVYVVAGGTGPRRAPLERACHGRGVASCFRFAGLIGRAEMVDYLALADMVIMPSESEGMSLACLEAMACGKLVIASDIPGMREIIADGETGLLFRLGDVSDLAAKTLLAARDPDVRKRIGRAARANVERHHRLEDMVDRYEAALTGLVERAPARHRARGEEGPV